jgi:hypothetical protein
MASDFCLIAHSSKGDSVKLTAKCFSDRFAQGCLSDTWWPKEAQDGSFVVFG